MPRTLLKDRLNKQGNDAPIYDQEPEKPDLMSTRYISPVVNKLNKKNNAPKQQPSEYMPEVRNEEEYEQLMLSDEDKKELERLRRKKKQKYVGKFIQCLLALGCVYLVFLIYGALNTNFTYDTRGNVVPVVLTVDGIKATADFTSMSGQYLQARTLYERVLLLDYRLGTGLEDPIFIAPEYEKILEDVTKLSVQTSAITVPAQYTQPMNMLISWIQNDIALYCQFISRAITKNSVSDMNQALLYKETMYNNFMQITEVVAKLGSQVENVDIQNLIEWSPEAFIQQQSGGVQ